MTENKGIAESIINEGTDPDEEGEEGEEDVTLEEELEALHESAEGMQERFGKIASKLRASGKTPASKADLAELYETLSGEVLDLLKDLVGATASGFDQEEDEDEEGDEGEKEVPDDNTVQVYTTLIMNSQLFKTLQEDAKFSAEQRASFTHMVQINEDSLRIFEEQYDVAVLQKLAQERIAEANGKS
jgi:hypothetical protein